MCGTLCLIRPYQDSTFVHGRDHIVTRFKTALAFSAIGFFSLTGCGNDADEEAISGVQAPTEDVPVGDFEAAVQGVWSCQSDSQATNGAYVYLFHDTEGEVSYIKDGAQIEVGDGGFRVIMDDLIVGGSYEVDGTTWTLRPDLGGALLEQSISGVPETQGEATAAKMLLVQNGNPDSRLRMVMPSPSQITFIDEDDDSTSCYKY